MMKNKKISAFLTIAILASTASQAFASTSTSSFTTDQTAAIKATNSFVSTTSSAVTVTIDGTKFKNGDQVKITGGTSFDQTVAITSTTTSVAISVPSLGVKSGSVKAYLTSSGSAISAAKSVAYNQAQSPALDSTTVSMQGNVDTQDVLTVSSGLTAKDKVVVYDGSKSIGNATLAATSTESSIKVNLTSHVTTASSIKISVTKDGAAESDKVAVDISKYTAPNQTSQPTVVLTGNIDEKSTVTFKSLPNNTEVKVYAADGTTVLGSGKATIAKTSTATAIDVVVSLDSKKFDSTTPGAIKVSARNYNQTASALETVNYAGPTATTAIDTSKVVCTNNAIMIAGLTNKDIITVYSVDPTTITDKDALKKATLATKTVASGDTYAFMTFRTDKTKIYITKRSYNDVVTSPISMNIPQ